MLKLALRNIVRQRMQTAITLLAIVVGVTGIILAGGWVSDIFSKLGEAVIHSQSGHIQIYRKGFFAQGSRSPEKYLIADPAALEQRLRGLQEVQDVMARLSFSGLLSNGRSDLPILIDGIEPAKENALGSALYISSGRRLEERDAFGIAVGAGVAQALAISPGDHVTILASTLDGALNTIDLEVVGIFQTFSNDYDARAVKMPLLAAQELLGSNGANAMVVALKHTRDTERVAALLAQQLDAAGLEVKTWVELNDFYAKTVVLYKRQFGVLELIILVMVFLSVTNAVNMGVFDRLGEFGTMMSLGDRSRRVFWLIVLENALLGLIGSALGVGLGILLAAVISAIGIPMPPPPNANRGYTAQIAIVPTLLATSYLLGLAATLFAALWPAARVSRTPVVEALRANI